MSNSAIEPCNVESVYHVEGFDFSRLVVIEAAALTVMRAFRQIGPEAHEAGGILIGERRGKSLVVKEVTSPSSKDCSSRFSFIRKYAHHQLAVFKANWRTDGTSNYIGEWHTHPQDRPYPSSIDFTNWKSCLHGYESCLVSVVGRNEEWWALYENGKFHQLSLVKVE